MEKFRAVFPFASTWHIGGDNKKAGFYRHKTYPMLAKHLGFEIEDLDETAGDVNRGHYYPACPEDKKEIAKCDSGDGKRLDPNILAIQTGIVSKYYVDGVDINLLLEQGQPLFKVDEWIRDKAPELKPENRNGGGVTINCPNGHNHNNGDVKGAFADQQRGTGKNKKSMSVRCEHHTCKKEGLFTPELIVEILRSPKFPTATVQSLMLPEYGMTPLQKLPWPFVYRKGKVIL